ncbi:glutamyl aminopeptidase [Aplysia californica]|uniref:Aminopeptidase n=1 Tax=Aplysia californica TaxID=6500 RepID=A0ABM1A9T8_APLCA|nr:glutamyl aminopeptidase [Aplysia californica]
MDSTKFRKGSTKRPLVILSALFLVVVIIVGVVVWKVTKDAYEGGTVAEVTDPEKGGSGGRGGGTTMRPYTKQEIQEKPWLSLRMLRDVLPLHYDITMFPDFYEDGDRFHGNETIELQVHRPTKFILIHVHTDYMNVTSAEVKDNSTQAPVSIRRTFVYKPNEFYVIEMSETISSPVMVELQFEGSMTKTIVGIYKGTYLNTATNQTRHLAASKFEPTFARQAFPCFDEPDIKAEYSITLLHRPGYVALSNMPNTGEPTAVVGRDNILATSFQRSVRMSTYLVTFVVGEFGSLNTVSDRGIPIRVFATPDKIQQAQFALDMAKHTLDTYERLYNQTYPLPKQDLIAIPEFVSGAMEHWGLIAFRETRMLYDPLQASLDDAEDVAHVVAHEMAHMWFGNLVTMAWWNDLWLNEGFASYMEYIGAATKETEWGLMDKFLPQDFFSVMPQDSALSSHPIIVDVQDPAQITSVFDAISYSKGASVIRMLKSIMGEAKFFEGVGLYLQRHKWGNARTDDLWGALSEVDPTYDVKHIMDTWTIQDGYPYINITLSTTSDGTTTVEATQKRFLLNPEAELDPSASTLRYKWYVPLSFQTSQGENGSKVMDMTDIKFSGNYGLSSPGSWIKFNVDQPGFYRVLYPDSQWQAFSQYLLTTDNQLWILGIADRAGLLNDAFTLASAGMTSYDIPLDMMSYLAKEEHVVPWSAALQGGVNYIRRMLRDDPDYGLWKSFIADRTRPIVMRVGFQDTGSHLERQLRSLVISVACQVGDSYTLSNITGQFRDWLDNGVTPSVNLRSAVYIYGMANSGDEADWDQIWNKYLVENSPQEKQLLAKTLAAARQPHLIARLLDRAYRGEGIRTQDFFLLINTVGGNTAARSIVWDWARANYQNFIDRFTVNDRYFGRMIYYMVRYYNTEFKLREVEALFRDFPEEGASKRYRKMAVESIRNNIDWMEKYRPGILQWLRR